MGLVFQSRPKVATDSQGIREGVRMSWKRHRSDDNQTEIVKVYRQLGWHVVITNQVGDGFPDLVVGKQ